MGKYYARIRVKGKLIVKSLKTTRISVAKLRLADLGKVERASSESSDAMTRGSMTFGQALEVYLAQFERFVSEIESSGSGHSKPCAHLVRFFAYGGFCVFRSISDSDSDSYRTRFRADIGQFLGAIGMVSEMSGTLSESFRNGVRKSPESRTRSGAALGELPGSALDSI
ncbi:MAG: hypothetical protein O2960_23950 [Verrucomicrobia bacterium]|nr:hypothetical protein [Verrucomicrobiota bacterium]